MKLALHTLTALIVVAVAPSAGAAQGAGPLALEALGVSPEALNYDAAAARARLDRAHQLAMVGRFGEAIREYAVVARIQKRAGVLPEEALWQLAALYFGQGNRLRAATTLDELAELSEAHGHPVLQARALIDAAVLYQQLEQPVESLRRLQRLEPLLSSPFLPAEERLQIERRIMRK